MKRLMLGGALFVAVASCAWTADGSFTSSMTPGDFEAAGLRKLNAGQLARLNALVEAYRNGPTPPAVRPEIAAPASPSAEVPPIAATPVPPKSEPAAPRPGLLATAKTLIKSTPRDEPPPLTSAIVGSFQGWKPRQVFTLASGERVQVANNESYYTPAVENPKIELTRASFAGYWLRFPELNVQVRVNLLSPR